MKNHMPSTIEESLKNSAVDVTLSFDAASECMIVNSYVSGMSDREYAKLKPSEVFLIPEDPEVADAREWEDWTRGDGSL